MPRSEAFIRIKADVLALTAAIPRRRLTTYAAIGQCVDVMARHVAYILSQLSDEERDRVPWHRVVGEKGKVSTTSAGRANEQATRLLAEGVEIDSRDVVVDFERLFHEPG